MSEVELANPEYWDGVSEYAQIAHPFTGLFAQEAWRQAKVPSGAAVLDIATGAGALPIAAAKDGAKVLATDFSRGMIDAVDALGLSGIETRVMDGQALDLPDASFDAAFSVFGIMLFAEWQKGLSEMSRVLKPGGIASVTTWKHPSGAGGNLLLAEIMKELFPELEIPPAGPPGMIEWSDPERFVVSLEKAGLVSAQIEEATFDFAIDTAWFDAAYRKFTTGPFYTHLDDDQRERVLAAARGRTGPDNLISVPSTALIATARKA